MTLPLADLSDLLAHPAAAAPLAGLVYATTSTKVLTVHDGVGCALALLAGRTFPTVGVSAGDLAALTARVLVGCPVCGTADRVAKFGDALELTVAVQAHAKDRMADALDDPGPYEWSHLRAALVEEWAFAGELVFDSLAADIVTAVGDPDEPFGPTSLSRWAAGLQDWVAGWCRDYALTHPELATGQAPATQRRLLAVVNSELATSTHEDTGLYRLDPIRGHQCSNRLGFAVFKVNKDELATLRRIVDERANQLRYRGAAPLRDAWVGTVKPRVQNLLADGAAWRLVIEMLSTSEKPPADLSTFFEAAQAALAHPEAATA